MKNKVKAVKGFEKKDMKADKKAGIKENSKLDKKLDVKAMKKGKY